MNGQEIVANMKKLRQVKVTKEITQLTHAIFPGTHCPLMGAMMAVRGITDSVMLVVGTDECTYYTKNTTIHNFSFGGLDGRCVSVVLDQHDVTFGSYDKITEAFEELMEEYNPKAVFLVSTCIVEIIGDDIDAMAEEYGDKYDIPVLAVHTEHFKTENHLPGVEDTITACFAMMEGQEKDNSVNIIGQRLGEFRSTELYTILKDANVEMGMMLPSGCTTEDIKKAPKAKVNIVVNPIGLPIAKKMERTYGIPYVLFDKYVNPQYIKETYEQLFAYLNIVCPEKINQFYESANNKKVEIGEKLKDLKYIYGNTPLQTFEFNAFMIEMGMIPQLIQTAELPTTEDRNLNYILENSDPYVTKTANIAPLQYVYDELKPNLYLGHEYAMRLKAKGIALVRSDKASSMLGFEITEFILTELLRAGEEAKELERSRKHESM
jgi:Nitrogenase molybdenum-iron protein, alpha and beta chains